MYIVSVEKITLLVRHILHSKIISKQPKKSRGKNIKTKTKLEIKAINSVFLLEIAGIRIDYCTPLKKKYARSKNKIETDFFNIQI